MTAGAVPRLIIPAPEEIRREQDVVWYEVEVAPAQSAARIVAFAEGRREVGAFAVELRPGGEVSAVISGDGHRVDLDVRRGDGERDVAGEIDGRAFSVGPAKPAEHLDLETATDELLRPWRTLRGPLEALRQAAGDEECTGCLLAGATVVQSAELCVGGDAGACSVLIDSYSFFQDICDPPPCH